MTKSKNIGIIVITKYLLLPQPLFLFKQSGITTSYGRLCCTILYWRSCSNLWKTFGNFCKFYPNWTDNIFVCSFFQDLLRVRYIIILYYVYLIFSHGRWCSSWHIVFNVPLNFDEEINEISLETHELKGKVAMCVYNHDDGNMNMNQAAEKSVKFQSKVWDCLFYAFYFLLDFSLVIS